MGQPSGAAAGSRRSLHMLHSDSSAEEGPPTGGSGPSVQDHLRARTSDTTSVDVDVVGGVVETDMESELDEVEKKQERHFGIKWAIPASGSYTLTPHPNPIQQGVSRAFLPVTEVEPSEEAAADGDGNRVDVSYDAKPDRPLPFTAKSCTSAPDKVAFAKLADEASRQAVQRDGSPGAAEQEVWGSWDIPEGVPCIEVGSPALGQNLGDRSDEMEFGSDNSSGDDDEATESDEDIPNYQQAALEAAAGTKEGDAPGAQQQPEGPSYHWPTRAEMESHRQNSLTQVPRLISAAVGKDPIYFSAAAKAGLSAQARMRNLLKDVLKAMTNRVDSLKRNVFKDQVNQIRVPDYCKYVASKDEVWLQLIRERINRGEHASLESLLTDFEQMLANAKAYNSPGNGQLGTTAIIEWAEEILRVVKEEADKCKADCEKLLPLVQAERACGLGLEPVQRNVRAAIVLPEGFTVREVKSVAKPRGYVEYMAECPVHGAPKRLDRWREVVDFLKAHCACREEWAEWGPQSDEQEEEYITRVRETFHFKRSEMPRNIIKTVHVQGNYGLQHSSGATPLKSAGSRGNSTRGVSGRVGAPQRTWHAAADDLVRLTLLQKIEESVAKMQLTFPARQYPPVADLERVMYEAAATEADYSRDEDFGDRLRKAIGRERHRSHMQASTHGLASPLSADHRFSNACDALLSAAGNLQVDDSGDGGDLAPVEEDGNGARPEAAGKAVGEGAHADEPSGADSGRSQPEPVPGAAINAPINSSAAKAAQEFAPEDPWYGTQPQLSLHELAEKLMRRRTSEQAAKGAQEGQPATASRHASGSNPQQSRAIPHQPPPAAGEASGQAAGRAATAEAPSGAAVSAVQPEPVPAVAAGTPEGSDAAVVDLAGQPVSAPVAAQQAPQPGPHPRVPWFLVQRTATQQKQAQPKSSHSRPSSSQPQPSSPQPQSLQQRVAASSAPAATSRVAASKGQMAALKSLNCTASVVRASQDALLIQLQIGKPRPASAAAHVEAVQAPAVRPPSQAVDMGQPPQAAHQLSAVQPQQQQQRPPQQQERQPQLQPWSQQEQQQSVQPHSLLGSSMQRREQTSGGRGTLGASRDGAAQALLVNARQLSAGPSAPQQATPSQATRITASTSLGGTQQPHMAVMPAQLQVRTPGTAVGTSPMTAPRLMCLGSSAQPPAAPVAPPLAASTLEPSPSTSRHSVVMLPAQGISPQLALGNVLAIARQQAQDLQRMQHPALAAVAQLQYALEVMKTLESDKAQLKRNLVEALRQLQESEARHAAAEANLQRVSADLLCAKRSNAWLTARLTSIDQSSRNMQHRSNAPAGASAAAMAAKGPAVQQQPPAQQQQQRQQPSQQPGLAANPEMTTSSMAPGMVNSMLSPPVSAASPPAGSPSAQAQQRLEEDPVARAIAAALGRKTVPKAAQNPPGSAESNSAADRGPLADDMQTGMREGKQGTKRECPSHGDHDPSSIAKRGRGDIDAQSDPGDFN